MIDKEELIKALPLATEYTEIKIPKRRGGYRTLLIPSPELKKIQRKILRYYLRKIFDWGWGGIYGLRSSSYVRHAEYHSDSRFILVFDLEDAFPSVNLDLLKEIIFKRLILLPPYFVGLYPKESAKELAELIIKLTSFKGILPQGAPTSPYLFYLAITESGLFSNLRNLCPPEWKISCYVDGFVISGPKPLNPETKEEIFKCVEKFGFKINPRKIHQFDCRQGAPLICGIRVDGKGRISLPKKKIRKWRGIIHRASFNPNPKLIKKINGFITSLKPIYGKELPHQIEKPYLIFKTRKQTRLTNWM